MLFLDEEIQIVDGEYVDFKKLYDFSKKEEYSFVSLNFETFEFEEDHGKIKAESNLECFQVICDDGKWIVITKNQALFTNCKNEIITKTIKDGLDVGQYILNDDVKFSKITKIVNVGYRKVIGLIVFKNHNFINKNGIVAYDYVAVA